MSCNLEALVKCHVKEKWIIKLTELYTSNSRRNKLLLPVCDIYILRNRDSLLSLIKIKHILYMSSNAIFKEWNESALYCQVFWQIVVCTLLLFLH